MTHLARDTISTELASAIDQISEAVRQGHVVGAIFGLHLKGRRYMVNVAGTLARDPTLGRGINAALDDELARLVQGSTDSDTTL